MMLLEAVDDFAVRVGNSSHELGIQAMMTLHNCTAEIADLRRQLAEAKSETESWKAIHEMSASSVQAWGKELCRVLSLDENEYEQSLRVGVHNVKIIIDDANARIARLQAECIDWRDWQRRLANDEGVCGFVHHHDYGLYSRIADPDVSLQAVDAHNDLEPNPKL